MKNKIKNISLQAVLVVLIVLMTAGIALQGYSHGNGLSLVEIGQMMACATVFVVAAYINFQVLTPRLLLCGRTAAYIVCLVCEILLVLAGIVVVSSVSGNSVEGWGERPWVGVLNLLGVLVLVGLVLVSTTSYALARHNIRERQREDALIRARKESELAALRRQVSPHFIFNMLNNAITLVRVDPDEGAVLLDRLNDLLHYQIDECRDDDMPLNAEVRHISQFLEIEKIRHDDMLVSVNYDGNGGDVRIPALLFFPVVENAVKHNHPDGGTTPYIDIEIGVADGELRFVCTNSRGSKKGPSGGLGLANLRRRLELVYPGRHTIEIAETSTKYTLTINIEL